MSYPRFPATVGEAVCCVHHQRTPKPKQRVFPLIWVLRKAIKLVFDNQLSQREMIPPIIIAFFPALGFSCLDAIAAYMVNVVGMTIFQVMVCRNVSCPHPDFAANVQTLATSILIPYLFYKETPHAPIGPPGSRTILWTRGVLVTINLFFVYTSLRYLPLSEFWMVNSCTPFPTAILCWWFLSEKFTRIQGICCCE